jgi:protein-ribulosamine 3-kinase
MDRANLCYYSMPELVVRPYGYGSYKSMKDIHFFLCAFHKLTGDVPDVEDFPALVAEFHQRGVCPGGKFGFPHKVYGGRLPQFFPVTNTWEETFTAGLQHSFKAEEETHGYDKDMADLRKGIIDNVVPRLIRPLERRPNKIQPTLVHGDLWDGNCSVDLDTKQPVIFDSTALWAHNECQNPIETNPLLLNHWKHTKTADRRTGVLAAYPSQDE